MDHPDQLMIRTLPGKESVLYVRGDIYDRLRDSSKIVIEDAFNSKGAYERSQLRVIHLEEGLREVLTWMKKVGYDESEGFEPAMLFDDLTELLNTPSWIPTSRMYCQVGGFHWDILIDGECPNHGLYRTGPHSGKEGPHDREGVPYLGCCSVPSDG